MRRLHCWGGGRGTEKGGVGSREQRGGKNKSRWAGSFGMIAGCSKLKATCGRIWETWRVSDEWWRAKRRRVPREGVCGVGARRIWLWFGAPVSVTGAARGKAPQRGWGGCGSRAAGAVRWADYVLATERRAPNRAGGHGARRG